MIKRTIKTSLAGLLYYSGLLKAARRSRRSRYLKGWAVILMYHRVLPASSAARVPEGWERFRSLAGIVVSPETFEKQIAFLRVNYHLMSLPELAERIENGSEIPPGSVVITFDDGWRDNYVYAFPILKKHAVPATIFLTAEFVGTNRLFWPEKLIALFDLAARSERDGVDLSGRDISGELTEAVESILRTEGPARDELTGRLIERVKFMEPAARDHLLECLTGELGSLPDERVMLDWEEVRRMHEGGIDFGSHGLSHEIMTEIGEERRREELVHSRAIIEQKLCSSCLTIAYPNGNHDDQIKALAKGAGYRCAVAVSRGVAAQGSDLFALNRLNVHENTTKGPGGGFSRAQFACRLNGI